MFKEGHWNNYHNTYNRRKVPASFSIPKDDGAAILETFRDFESKESLPSPIRAVFIGAAGPEAIKKMQEIFRGYISDGNPQDELTIVDIRDFNQRDYDAIFDKYRETTFLSKQDARELQFRDDSFNLILTHCLFPCLEDDGLNSVLEEMQRVTKPGGFGIHTFSEKTLLANVCGTVWATFRRKKAGMVYKYRSKNEIENFLNNNGFQISNLRSVYPYENLTVGCVKTENPVKYTGGLTSIREGYLY